MATLAHDGSTGVVRSAGYNLIGQFLPLAVALVSMPVVVRGLGPARFGVLALSWTVVGYFGLFDLGFGRAATQRIASLTARGQPAAAIAAVARTVIVAQGLIGAVGGVLLWVSAGPLAALLVPDSSPLQSEGAAVLRVLGLGLPAVLMANACRAVLEGRGRFDLVNAVRAPFSAALFVVPAAGVLAGWSLDTIVAALVVSRWAAVLVYGWIEVRVWPAKVPAFTRSEFVQLARFGAWVALSNALIPAVIYLERVMLTALRGPEALGYYAAPHELMLKFLVVPAALTSVLYPLFSGFRARDESRALLRSVAESTRWLALLVAPATALLIVLAQPLLTFWLGPEHGVVGAPVLRLLATAAFLNSLALVPFVLLEGAGRPDLVAKYHLVEFPFYCGMLWFAVAQFGIVGAAAAWLTRICWMTPVLFAMGFRITALRRPEPLLWVAVPAVLTGVLTQAIAHIWVAVANTKGLVWLGLAVPLVHVLVTWKWLLTRADRDWLRTLPARLLPPHAHAVPGSTLGGD